MCRRLSALPPPWRCSAAVGSPRPPPPPRFTGSPSLRDAELGRRLWLLLQAGAERGAPREEAGGEAAAPPAAAAPCDAAPPAPGADAAAAPAPPDAPPAPPGPDAEDAAGPDAAPPGPDAEDAADDADAAVRETEPSMGPQPLVRVHSSCSGRAQPSFENGGSALSVNMRAPESL